MMDFAGIERAVSAFGLSVVGGFHPGPNDGVTQSIRTLLLLGPGGPAMWNHFAQSPEYQDDAPHGMDRWSRRVISGLAEDLLAEAIFPFGGPPWAPFQKWATLGEHAVSSPVGMQAAPNRGLWASYRGALLFQEMLGLPEWPSASPCAPCPAPCRTACPVDAFATGTYDTKRCVAHVLSPEGEACRDGCLVRKSCPAGQQIQLPAEQRTFHMAAFLAAHSG